MSLIADFISQVQAVHKTGAATEHSYRPALQTLFSGLADGVTALNEPKRVACGAPDFIIQRGELIIGHAEAKDIGIGLRGMKDANKNQQERYKNALSNLIYTNCLDWDFYRNGELIASVTVADYLLGIQPRPDQYEKLENLLRDFIGQRPQTITSPRVLAEKMAGKAILIKDVLANALKADSELTTELTNQYRAFKEHLIHDIKPDDFADIYAETIAYGMFAARLHDTTLETFTRSEALELLPKSNPFLRSLFAYIAGHDLDDRIAWIIDDLADVFQATDVKKIMAGFGKLTGQQDPFLHFYETFLAAYNPAKRKARGVWYTPEPVVNFIVRAVDEVLQTEFGLPDGLADTSKVTIDWDIGQTDKKGKRVTTKKDVHRVQILDPATGTGTFLAEAIKQIAPKVKNVAEGMWSQYIEKDLIPRLHGFELLMASYAMCHMKLDMILTELGYKPTGDKSPRLGVYLTNSLEEAEPANQTLPFAQWLSNEVREANTVKRDMPIMCIIGNPPYSGESANKGNWIMGLMDAYKKEPGGKEKLKERNPKWINDDYVKFIRFSEYLIEKNGEGVLGFITNHGYLDNPTFRGMRWHLLKTFHKIYVIDLHGNYKKREVSPDGSQDKNVFDIQQGVSIIIALKNKEKKGIEDLSQVFHSDFWGDRTKKYSSLLDGSVKNIKWNNLTCKSPQFAFVSRDFGLESLYQNGFEFQNFMPVNSVGIVTARDSLTIDIDKDRLANRIKEFITLSPDEARERYDLGPDARDWSIIGAQQDILKNISPSNLKPIAYRPFDYRWTHYTGISKGFHCNPRNEVMQHLLPNDNIAIDICRQSTSPNWSHVFICNSITDDSYISNKSKERGYVAPLYISANNEIIEGNHRVNFNANIYSQLKKLAAHPKHGQPDEMAVFDYIYGALHCPAYRETYAEFLKTDFPRIPWPSSPDEFWDVSDKGGQLRKLHLMDASAIGTTPYALKGEGDSTVEKARFEGGKIWINAQQYFENVPPVSWDFYIGGYQPAQKWLKDRKGRALSFDDVKHYQKILKILAETDRIMKTISMKLGGDTH
ncbi:type ISP restriction/modification enzyme [Arenimonas maotaiensis]|nr:type ISP restriction/modification enzyme [Arenimonas maotaiensis]